MKILIHRGSKQIGGIAVEISTETTRLIVDIGKELPGENADKITPLEIDGVTNTNGKCNAILISHIHDDHIGHLPDAMPEIPVYMGALSKRMYEYRRRYGKQDLASDPQKIHCFKPGEAFMIGDIQVTAFTVDHSACDSYMFLFESEGKRVLYTGDFRLHGFRGNGLRKLLKHKIPDLDLLITEGTHLSDNGSPTLSERALAEKLKSYIQQYKYVFILCASGNLERLCAFSKAVPRGKYFICDHYQGGLLDLIEENWGHYSPLYRRIKKTIYGKNLLPKFAEKGFVMAVRDNSMFREIISQFDPDKSILLYSMWKGYLDQENSTLPSFLELTGRWEHFHTSGHVSQEDLVKTIQLLNPKYVLPVHTDTPQRMSSLIPAYSTLHMNDGDIFQL